MDLAQVADTLEQQHTVLVARVVERVWNQVDGYQAPRMRASDYADAVGPNLRAILQTLGGERVDRSVYAHAERMGSARALQGVPPEAVVLSYRHAERVLTEAFLAESAELERSEVQAGLVRIAEAVDALTTASFAAHQQTQKEITLRYDRLASDLITGLVAGDLKTERMDHLTNLLECETTTPWRAIALSTKVTEDMVEIGAVQREILAVLGKQRDSRILVGSVRSWNLLLIPGTIEGDDIAALRQVLARHPTISPRITIGDPASALGKAGVSCRQALDAMEVIINRNDTRLVTMYKDTLLDILATADEEASSALREQYYEPIAPHPHLIETIIAFADADLSIQVTADNLYVHRNTILYRLLRVDEITGHDPRSAHELFAFMTAIRIARTR